MKKLILMTLLFLSVTNAYAYVDAVSLSVANYAAATASANAADIEQAKRDNDDIQLGIAICSTLQTNAEQSQCLITLKNKLQQQRDAYDAFTTKVALWFVAFFIIVIGYLIFLLTR
jgi:hypothetical protein